MTATGSDLVLQRQARTVEQLRLKNVHQQKMLQKQIGEKGHLETKSKYDMKMLHKEKLKIQRDFEYLRLRAAKTIRWTELLEQQDRERELAELMKENSESGSGESQRTSVISRNKDNKEMEDFKTKESKESSEAPPKSGKVKIKMPSRRMAKLHHRYSKDLKRAQEDSKGFLETIESPRDKYEVLRELEDLFRPKSAKTMQSMQRKEQRRLEILEQAKRQRFTPSNHTKKRYKEVTLAEIDVSGIRNKIETRFRKEKTMELLGTKDRDEVNHSPIFGDGTFLPKLHIDFSKIQPKKVKQRKEFDILDFASSIGQDKWPKQKVETPTTGKADELGKPGISILEIPDDVIDGPDDVTDGDWMSSAPNGVDWSNPEFFNPDGSLRTQYTLPDAGAAFTEARKARYLRKRDSCMRDSLDFDKIFDRKQSDIAEESEPEDTHTLRPDGVRSPATDARAVNSPPEEGRKKSARDGAKSPMVGFAEST